MRARQVIFVALAMLALLPVVSASMALLVGILFALSWGNPFPEESKALQVWMLQGAVVGLAGSMDLRVVLRVGGAGVGQTLVGLVLTLGLAWVLARALGTEKTSSLLIGVGTAICGGSAIAAVGPAIGAKSHQMSVALAVVFLLNGLALLLFPPIGRWAELTGSQFGLWSALAIHDTSSVVGASMQFGEASLAVGTTVKLARSLWIIPVTVLLARFWKREGPSTGAPKRPWFILGFLGVAAVVTWVPALRPGGQVVAGVARQILVATLFLVGVGVSRDALRRVGFRPVVLGGLLWLVVASATLAGVRAGWLSVASLQ